MGQQIRLAGRRIVVLLSLTAGLPGAVPTEMAALHRLARVLLSWRVTRVGPGVLQVRASNVTAFTFGEPLA